jgi:hypothetical protein
VQAAIIHFTAEKVRNDGQRKGSMGFAKEDDSEAIRGTEYDNL